MADFLQRVLKQKRSEVAALCDNRSPCIASPAPRRELGATLTQPGLSVIAEFKRRSPSAGALTAADTDVVSQVRGYARGGAAALSVLTDRSHFGGSLDDLVAARSAVDLPVLCKDFLIDRRQIDVAADAGADAVLLIVRILDDGALSILLRHVHAAGLEALVETHDAAEIERAVDAGARIVGVNNRDLDTLEVDLERCLRLRAHVPAGCIAVAESGIGGSRDLRAVAAAGYDAALVGSSLMTGDSAAWFGRAREVAG